MTIIGKINDVDVEVREYANNIKGMLFELEREANRIFKEGKVEHRGEIKVYASSPLYLDWDQQFVGQTNKLVGRYELFEDKSLEGYCARTEPR